MTLPHPRLNFQTVASNVVKDSYIELYRKCNVFRERGFQGLNIEKHQKKVQKHEFQ